MSEVKINQELKEKSENGVESEQNTEPADQVLQADQEDDLPQDLEAELARAREEIVELKDRMLRAVAEQENFKKRVERERLASLKYAGEAIFREILPTVDNLERAIGQGVVQGVEAEKNLAALTEGVELTLKSLIATLEKFEVKAVESIGQPFDPQHQEALTMEASDTVPANHVLGEFEKGYNYKDRLLRAAKVIVSSGEK